MVVLAFDSEGGADMGREKLVELTTNTSLTSLMRLKLLGTKMAKSR